MANFVGVSNKIGNHFVRPENLSLSRENNGGIPVKVKNVRFGGMYYEYTVGTASEAGSIEEYRVFEINLGNGSQEWKVGEQGFLSVIHKDGLVSAYEE